MNQKQLGKYGEKLAINYLIKQKYLIIAKNYTCRSGEIDIIAKDKNELVFLEVKTRNSLNYGNPVDAVNNYKKKHILETTRYFLYKNNLENSFIRFDVIEVYMKKNNKYFINQIRNIFF